VVSPDNADKANSPASLDNLNRRKVAKVRMERTKTTRNAIVSVVLRSFPMAMFTDHLEVPARPGLHFVCPATSAELPEFPYTAPVFRGRARLRFHEPYILCPRQIGKLSRVSEG
jgi:hypothetical protein